MTRTERVEAAVNGAEVDRVPVMFWHHFQPEGSGRAMANATLQFFDEEFDLDIAKVMPDIPYPFPRKSIASVDDWRLIEPIDPAEISSMMVATFATLFAALVASRLARTRLAAWPIVSTLALAVGLFLYEV